jgi:hypothetical protein
MSQRSKKRAAGSPSMPVVSSSAPNGAAAHHPPGLREQRSRATAMISAAVFVLAACSTRVPTSPHPIAPVEGAEVDIGSLILSQAVVSFDVLIPTNGDIPAALEIARKNAKRDGLVLVDSLPATASDAMITVQLKSFADEGWSARLPGYIASKIDPDELPEVESSSGIVRLEAHSAAARGWELLRTVTMEARDLGAAQHGWIYDPYRAELHSPDTLSTSIPEPRMRDVRAITRIMGVVSTKGGLDHVRTIGLWRLGLPELYLPDVAHADLDHAMDLVRATAQTIIEGGGVTRRGVIEVDLSKLPPDWPRPASGTGRFTWRARWMRGPIHQNAMVVLLSIPGAKEKDPGALAAALHAYAGE